MRNRGEINFTIKYMILFFDNYDPLENIYYCQGIHERNRIINPNFLNPRSLEIFLNHQHTKHNQQYPISYNEHKNTNIK